MSSASIVVLCFNQLERTTKPCVESIVANTDLKKHQLVLVDNASTDQTPQYLRDLETRTDIDVRIVLNSSNLGYAGGNNRGIDVARGDVIILLNNDTLVTPSWVEKLIEPLESEAVGLVGPISNSVGNHQVIDIPNLDEDNYIKTSESYTRSRCSLVYESTNLGFFCVAARAATFDQLGGLDEDFGIGMFEDDEFCQRVIRAGLKLMIREDCFIYHKGSVSFRTLESETYENQFQKNRELYRLKTGLEWTYSRLAKGFQHQLGELLYKPRLEFGRGVLLESVALRDRFFKALLDQTESQESKNAIVARNTKSKLSLFKEYLRKDLELIFYRVFVGLRRPLPRRKMTALTLNDIAEIQKKSRHGRYLLLLPGVDFAFLRLSKKKLMNYAREEGVSLLFVSNCDLTDHSLRLKEVAESCFLVNHSILNFLEHLCPSEDLDIVITETENSVIPYFYSSRKTTYKNLRMFRRSFC